MIETKYCSGCMQVKSIDIKDQIVETANAFTVTDVSAGDELAPGSILNVLIDVTTVDTAEAVNGHVQINGVSVAVPSYR